MAGMPDRRWLNVVYIRLLITFYSSHQLQFGIDLKYAGTLYQYMSTCTCTVARLTATSSLCHEHTLDWEIGVSLLQDRESGTISLLHCDNLTLSLDTLDVF